MKIAHSFCFFISMLLLCFYSDAQTLIAQYNFNPGEDNLKNSVDEATELKKRKGYTFVVGDREVTIAGSPAPVADRFGVPNAAYSFRAYNQPWGENFDRTRYITNSLYQESGFLLEDSVTISLWLNVPRKPGGWEIITAMGLNTFMITLTSDGKIHAGGLANSLETINASTPIPPYGEWFHFVATRTLDSVNVYINSEWKASAGGRIEHEKFIPLTNNPLEIGTRIIRDYGFNGLIDDIRIYDGVLSAKDIEEIYAIESVPVTAIHSAEYVSDGIRLFPNPATDFLQVETLAPGISIEKLEILDINGRSVQKQMSFSETSGSVRVSLAELLPGTYFVKITGEQGVYMKKMIRSSF